MKDYQVLNLQILLVLQILLLFEERDIFRLLNEHRKKNNLIILNWSEEVAKVSREHSKAMGSFAISFGHENYNERSEKLKKISPKM